MTRAPARRPGLVGLAAVRGMAVPVYDLAALLGASGGEPTRMVVVDRFGGVGLLVERAEIVGSDATDAELDLSMLTPPASAPRPARDPVQPGGPGADAEPARKAFVVVEAGERLYALPAARVRSVSRTSGPISAAALATLLHPREPAQGGARRIFKIEDGDGGSRAIAASGGELVRVDNGCIDPAPATLKDGGMDRVLQLDGGRRLAAVLEVERLPGGASDGSSPPMSTAETPHAPEVDPAEAVLVRFRIGERTYAAPAAMAEATLRHARLTRAPGAAPGVCGATGWRGRVVPVLGVDTAPPWLLILRLGGESVGVALTQRPELVRRLRRSGLDVEHLDRAAAGRLRRAFAEAGA